MFALLIVACLGADADPRHTEFSQAMSGVEMVGSFTVDGKAEDGQLKKESYTIRSVEKLPEGDLWRFVARIQYGETDIELPMDLPVKWAENTAVITLDNVWLPGLGTFSSRVLIRRKRTSWPCLARRREGPWLLLSWLVANHQCSVAALPAPKSCDDTFRASMN